MDNPVIAIDFDDTICESKYPECGKPKEGVKEALLELKRLGYMLLIYSCRTCHWHYEHFKVSRDIPVEQRYAVIKMKEFLDVNEIPYDEIDDGSRGKPLAHFFVDDKAIRFENNWKEIVKFIKDTTLNK